MSEKSWDLRMKKKKKRQKVFIFALHTQCIKKVQPKIDRSQEDS